MLILVNSCVTTSVLDDISSIWDLWKTPRRCHLNTSSWTLFYPRVSRKQNDMLMTKAIGALLTKDLIHLIEMFKLRHLLTLMELLTASTSLISTPPDATSSLWTSPTLFLSMRNFFRYTTSWLGGLIVVMENLIDPSFFWQISYKFSSLHHLQKPLAACAAFFTVFIMSILISKVKFNIGVTQVWPLRKLWFSDSLYCYNNANHP